MYSSARIGSRNQRSSRGTSPATPGPDLLHPGDSKQTKKVKEKSFPNDSLCFP